jgi:hypothetical protein
VHLFKPLDCPTSNAPCSCMYQQLSMSGESRLGAYAFHYG